ncbi:glycerophosphodiester phosphodiesterase [Shinella sedimenti]|uniref:Glycerophosphodiester phosphodiesterase n=1 Tax=Shinella sedimenti TaxID=2919913 RepID=A0ABT0CGH1_9HYPH|nr:glycerophosphodiester phosphodiesterase [Shinella sedimenti]MCJ8147703.1 glycerophosphodiester phosphodiesterase [Shinella sedimenti]
MHKFNWLTERPIAHRGYHDLNRAVWENTLSAFSRAVEAGFSIECDLQYAADAIPVVFHDDDLKRLCGIEGDVRQRTAGELALLPIGGTGDRIPTLRQLLDLVKGRVPLILELKGRNSDDEGFAMAVLDALEGYDGPVALMSFDHWLLKDLTAIGTDRPVGLTAEGARPENFAAHEEAMQYGLDFISYHYGHLPNAFISRQRDLGKQIITWTVRDEEARTITALNADQMTFEGFDPHEPLTA